MGSHTLQPGEQVIYYTDKASHLSAEFVTAELILTNMNIVVARYPNKFLRNNKNDIRIQCFPLVKIDVNEGVARLSTNPSKRKLTIYISKRKEEFEFENKKTLKQWASGIKQLLLSMNLINSFDEDAEDEKAMTFFSVARYIVENIDI